MESFINFGYFKMPLENLDGTAIGNKPTTVISLNSNVCYVMNFDSFIRFKDPGNMLHWFESELEKIEAAGGVAIVLSHVPNHSECLRQYGRRYHAIVDKYQHIIRFMISSHIHREQWQVIRDMVESKPIGMSYIVGSATPYQGKNPSFNILKMDKNTIVPVDFETHYLDIVESNKQDKPIWGLKFNYRDHFNLTDLSPQSFYKQAEHMYFDSDAAATYRDFQYVGGPSTWKPAPCDFQCRLKFHCFVLAGDYDEYQFCARRDKV